MPNPDLFTYIAPTDDTAPRYQRIRAAETACSSAISHNIYDHQVSLQLRFQRIAEACQALHTELIAVCPPSADLSAAVRCVRIVRMAANEAVAQPHSRDRCATLAADNLALARWQACAAVALALPAELPPLT